MNLKTVFLLPALLITGCATDYVPPTAGVTARMTLVTEAKANTDTYLFTYAARDCKGAKSLGLLQNYGFWVKKEIVTNVSASHDFIGYIRQHQDPTYCGKTFSFRPEANREYVVVSGATGVCSVVVYRVDPTAPSGRVLEPSQRLEQKQCSF